MTDDNRPHPDPDDDPTTVTRWPPFGQPGDNAPTADETQTQWAAADQPAAESPAAESPAAESPAAESPPDETPDQGGWFTPPQADPSPSEEPQWADWDEPWQPPDEPLDQAALPPSQSEVKSKSEGGTEPAEPAEPAEPSGPPANPAPAAPLEYVAPYPTAGDDRTSQVGGDQPDHPVSEQPAGAMAARTASLANLHYLRVLAQVACPILLFIGLTVSEDNVQRGWQAYTAWACFAMACALLQLAPVVGRSLGATAENAWFLAAVGTAGLVGYWVIIVLPGVSSNTGFAQTLAAGFAVIGLWLSPGRRV